MVDDFGPLTPYLSSPDVSEIMVNGPNKIFVEQNGKIVQVERAFTSDADLLRVVRQLLAAAGKTLSPQMPMIDTRTSDGSRMTVTMPPVTVSPSFTIRRPLGRIQELGELVTKGSLSVAMVEFLRIAVQLRANLLISGGTSCGKTTLLNAIGGYMPRTHRIITIEDTYEIRLPHPNWLPLETVFQGRGEGGTVINMRSLMEHALHLRPDRILMGEIRGGEALDLLQAMNSGHDGSMATIHASSPADALTRLETLVLMAGYEIPLPAIRQQIARAIQLVVQMRRTPEGLRQISAIAEVTGLSDGRFQLQDIFVFGRHRATGQTGYFPTGYTPSFLARAAASGVVVPANLFGLSAAPSTGAPPNAAPLL